MKNLKNKLIGTLGIAVMAMAMFFSTNVANSSNGELDLASLLEVNTANAECNGATFDAYCYTGSVCVLICQGQTTNGYGWSNTP